MTRILSLAALLSVACAPAAALAAGEPAAKPGEAPNAVSGAPAAAPKATPKSKVPFPYDGTPGNLLTKLLKGRSEDPLRFLAGDMKTIVGDLGAYKTDKPVQAKEVK